MKVFISHAFTENDIKLARRIADTLRRADFDVWDYTQLMPGDNWAESVANALRESDAMVVLLTSDSIHSRNLEYEINYALAEQAYKGRLIPVLAPSAEHISLEEIPWILKRFQMIHLSNLEHDEECLKQITQALKKSAV